MPSSSSWAPATQAGTSKGCRTALRACAPSGRPAVPAPCRWPGDCCGSTARWRWPAPVSWPAGGHPVLYPCLCPCGTPSLAGSGARADFKGRAGGAAARASGAPVCARSRRRAPRANNPRYASRPTPSILASPGVVRRRALFLPSSWRGWTRMVPAIPRTRPPTVITADLASRRTARRCGSGARAAVRAAVAVCAHSVLRFGLLLLRLQ